MTKAAVFIVSYGADEMDDFQPLAAESELRDPDLDHWLWYDLHAPLQKQQWQVGQTVYLFQPYSTSRSDYLVACRVVSRTSKAKGRPYRELVAVYVDRAQFVGEEAPEAVFASVPWDALMRERAGAVDLAAAKLGASEFALGLRDQVAGLSEGSGPVVCERFWENLAAPGTLYWVLSGVQSPDKTKLKAVTGISSGWNLFKEFDLRVLAVKEETSYDPQSAVFKASSQRLRSKILLEFVPNSYLELRAASLVAEWLAAVVMEAEAKPLQDVDLIASMLSSLEHKLKRVNGDFGLELAAAKTRERLDSTGVTRIEQNWGLQINPVNSALQGAVTAVRRLQPATSMSREEAQRIAEKVFAEKHAAYLLTVPAATSTARQDYDSKPAAPSNANVGTHEGFVSRREFGASPIGKRIGIAALAVLVLGAFGWGAFLLGTNANSPKAAVRSGKKGDGSGDSSVSEPGKKAKDTTEAPTGGTEGSPKGAEGKPDTNPVETDDKASPKGKHAATPDKAGKPTGNGATRDKTKNAASTEGTTP